MHDLKIVYEPVGLLKPAPRNVRTHSKKHIRQLEQSIRDFGFCIPILCDDDDHIVAGHGRLEAAGRLGHDTVPVIRLKTLTPAELRAFAIAENKLAERGGWDRNLLALEIKELSLALPDLDFTDIGFEVAEIDLLMAVDRADLADGPIAAAQRAEPAVTNLYDIWTIGDHRIVCGDATLEIFYTLLMQGEAAQMIFTDPPYNVRVNGHIQGKGQTCHPEFAMASGEMSPDTFTQFLRSMATKLRAVSVDGAIHYICMDFRHIRELLDACQGVYSEFKNLCVWTKTNAGMGSLYRSQHELVFVMKSGAAPHINNVNLGAHGRNRTNVWTYAGANAFGPDRATDLAMHPTVKPIALVADAILDCSTRGGIILDPFLGSGTAVIAAHRTGRRGFGMELDPWYVDVAVQRISAAVGEPAIHYFSGLTFDDLRARQRGGVNG